MTKCKETKAKPTGSPTGKDYPAEPFDFLGWTLLIATVGLTVGVVIWGGEAIGGDEILMGWEAALGFAVLAALIAVCGLFLIVLVSRLWVARYAASSSQEQAAQLPAAESGQASRSANEAAPGLDSGVKLEGKEGQS